MKKLKKNGGFTLIETLAALLIMVVLVAGMDTAMESASRIYEESVFQSDSASVAGILNTTMGDLFRYSTNIKVADADHPLERADGTPLAFVFTNAEFGIRDAYIQSVEGGRCCLQLKSAKDTEKPAIDLINGGVYPNMTIQNFAYAYSDGVFTVSYTLQSTTNASLSCEKTGTFRLMNP